ncbi:integrase core domain-containing protein [Saccharopolyspora sp. K220]|uniref:integrase core domain-containing protein n=1 Tax=Saccharopolyspora soli TaxID=2926618 RepID=UPI001F57DE89|nr:integrase core domain-containing protein [Saccharopolyspora soli]MCI2424389.1 integrase core domain-containing protein [Saccharopolyspora soli]
MTRKRAIMRLMDATLQAGVKIPNVSEWCRVNGVDRRTFYRHRARIEAEGRWEERSRRPKHCPHATPEPVVAEVLRLRQELAPDNGADPIRDVLIELAAEQDWLALGWRVPSRATINRILQRAGMVAVNPKKRPRSSYRRFSYARPRDCYQIDAQEITLAGGDTAAVFEVLDDCTRLLVAIHAAPGETAEAAITAITAARDAHGAPGIVPSDNGSAFTSRGRHPQTGPSQFARTVTHWGSRLIHSSPYHPQTCGKVERHHQTFQRWLDHQPEQPATLTELQVLATDYQDYYNHHRRHSALGRTTPAQAWQAADTLGGPTHPPAQTDATLHHLKVQTDGTVNLGTHLRIRIGSEHTGHTITIIRDHDRATAYTNNGNPIGYLHLDHTQRYQGTLTPAA